MELTQYMISVEALFDISIIKVHGSDIEVINSDGVSKLGGDDFDAKIIEMVQSII